ncbi:hypothetical protein LJY25_07005 [Hymenobacter sp. BT175]|uniref:hypothetical protein n=1 Tax=Hymenobacter translucens TaxID=2886507 RepID=UPI001D0E7330|nr:hypothetical protein [Hymenobacter translucens]MCC2546188.1 hypothetical protein [Hymenobacter translucens]
MLVLKRFVNILSMVYLLLALLFIVSPGSRDALMSTFGMSGRLESFYYTLFLVGAVLLALQLLTENLHHMTLSREMARHEGKVNELKARLYDHQMEQRDRDLQTRSVAPPVTQPVAAPASRVVPAPQPTAPPVQPTPVVVTPVTAAPSPSVGGQNRDGSTTDVSNAAYPHAPHAPVFPQSDPGLANAPLSHPNHIIDPSAPADDRAAR